MSDPDAEGSAPEEKSKGGRPRIEIDLEQLERYCSSCYPVLDEIAAFFRCSERTVQRRYEKEPEFAEIVDRGRALSRRKLRRAFSAAERRVLKGRSLHGDSSLVVLHAKQSEDVGGLGFKDKHEHDVRAKVANWSELVASEAGGSDPALGGDGGSDGDAEA